MSHGVQIVVSNLWVPVVAWQGLGFIFRWLLGYNVWLRIRVSSWTWEQLSTYIYIYMYTYIYTHYIYISVCVCVVCVYPCMYINQGVNWEDLRISHSWPHDHLSGFLPHQVLNLAGSEVAELLVSGRTSVKEIKRKLEQRQLFFFSGENLQHSSWVAILETDCSVSNKNRTGKIPGKHTSICATVIARLWKKPLGPPCVGWRKNRNSFQSVCKICLVAIRASADRWEPVIQKPASP